MKAFLIIIALTISNYSAAQNLMIYNSGVLKDSVDIGTTDSIIVKAFQCGINTVKYSNQVYHTVKIGSQCWLKENLNVGTMIAGTSEQTNNGIAEKYCYNDNSSNCTTYGGLYQWAEAVQYQNGATNTTSPNPAFTGNVQGICPSGWHIPLSDEFTTLSTSVGGSGNALKAVGQGTGPGAGTNTSGFSALLSGYRYTSGTFNYQGSYIYFWSSTEYNATWSNSMYLFWYNSNISTGSYWKNYGFSVRCVKDN